MLNPSAVKNWPQALVLLIALELQVFRQKEAELFSSWHYFYRETPLDKKTLGLVDFESLNAHALQIHGIYLKL